MNKFKIMFLMAAVLLISCVTPVSAEEKVKVYLFEGDGCPYCEKAQEFFKNEIGNDYKDKFELVEYEVWYNEENAALLQDVAATLGQEVQGVPFIVIGEEVFPGYSSEMNEDIKKAIEKEFTADTKYDVLKNLGKAGTSIGSKSSNSTVVILSLAIIVVGIAGLLIYAKKTVN